MESDGGLVKRQGPVRRTFATMRDETAMPSERRSATQRLLVGGSLVGGAGVFGGEDLWQHAHHAITAVASAGEPGLITLGATSVVGVVTLAGSGLRDRAGLATDAERTATAHGFRRVATGSAVVGAALGAVSLGTVGLDDAGIHIARALTMATDGGAQIAVAGSIVGGVIAHRLRRRAVRQGPLALSE